MLPLTIAGTVLGISLVNTFNTGWLVLTGTWMIMALAYFLRPHPPTACAPPWGRSTTCATPSRKHR
jgi:iron(III) transport system permease protein